MSLSRAQLIQLYWFCKRVWVKSRGKDAALAALAREQAGLVEQVIGQIEQVSPEFWNEVNERSP